MVEVVARDHDNQEIAVPVANLRLSCQPMVSCSRVFIVVRWELGTSVSVSEWVGRSGSGLPSHLPAQSG